MSARIFKMFQLIKFAQNGCEGHVLYSKLCFQHVCFKFVAWNTTQIVHCYIPVHPSISFLCSCVIFHLFSLICPPSLMFWFILICVPMRKEPGEDMSAMLCRRLLTDLIVYFTILWARIDERLDCGFIDHPLFLPSCSSVKLWLCKSNG